MKYVSCIFLCAIGLSAAGRDSLTVASVGRYIVTANDLMTSFEFGPAFVRRTDDPLREHLKYMIYERLIALQAEEQQLGETEFVGERVKALEEDGATEQLYRDDILSQVTLSDAQIERDVRKAKINVSLRWLFAETKTDIDRQAKVLASGGSFDSLFSLQARSVGGSESRSLETSLLKLERDNGELAAAVSTLTAGGISVSLKGKDGYYIVRLESAWQNPLTTEGDYAVLKDQAMTIRRKVVADELADGYVKTLMKQHDPVMKAEGLNILCAYIASKGLSRDTKGKWDILSTFMTEAGPQPIGKSEEYLNKPLVTFGERSLTIRDYARWYDIRQFQFDTRSAKAFTSSVKKTVWKMVQDKLLSEEAYRRGLERNPSVAHETKKWEAKLLYLAGRAALLRSINTSDSAVKRYYDDHLRRYRAADKKPMPFPQAKEAVLRDYIDEQESFTLLRTIGALKKKYPVTIDENVLRRLGEQVSPDPRAIDMIFYKPGGTFPRVAFPTIDEAWSRMR